MSFRSTLMASLVVLSVLALNGCGDEQTTPSQSSRFFVRGNPMVFVQNTIRNTSGTIREAQLDSDARYSLSVVSFEEVGQRQSYDQMMAGQNPENRRRASITQIAGDGKPDQHGEVSARPSGTAASDGYQFLRRGDGTVSFVTSQSHPVDMNFTVSEGVLNLRSITFAGTTEWVDKSFTILHNSSSPTGDAHSILILAKEGRRSALMAFRILLEPKTRSLIERASREFEFFGGGDGEKIGWNSDRPVEVQICEPILPVFTEMAEQSLREWNEALRGRLVLERGKLKRCPPFSDVNTHTVSMVPDWIDGYGPELMVNGITLKEISQSRGKIVGMDMFILIGEWDEYLKALGSGRKADDSFIRTGVYDNGRSVRTTMQRTFTHEFGHFIGLDHKFDGTRSIMSYDKNHIQLYDYDRRAVQALYDINPKLAQGAAGDGSAPNFSRPRDWRLPSR